MRFLARLGKSISVEDNSDLQFENDLSKLDRNSDVLQAQTGRWTYCFTICSLEHQFSAKIFPISECGKFPTSVIPRLLDIDYITTGVRASFATNIYKCAL